MEGILFVQHLCPCLCDGLHGLKSPTLGCWRGASKECRVSEDCLAEVKGRQGAPLDGPSTERIVLHFRLVNLYPQHL